jgi:hypothetical protein
MGVETINWNKKYRRDPEKTQAWRRGIGKKIIQSLSVRPKDIKTLSAELGYHEENIRQGMGTIRDRVRTVQSGFKFKYELKEKI